MKVGKRLIILVAINDDTDEHHKAQIAQFPENDNEAHFIAFIDVFGITSRD